MNPSLRWKGSFLRLSEQIVVSQNSGGARCGRLYYLHSVSRAGTSRSRARRLVGPSLLALLTRPRLLRYLSFSLSNHESFQRSCPEGKADTLRTVRPFSLQTLPLLPQQLLEVQHIPPRPRLGGPERKLELIRGDDGAEEFLRVKQTVLGARDEDECLDFKEVSELRGVDFPDADRVRLLVCARDERAQVCDEREVVCWLGMSGASGGIGKGGRGTHRRRGCRRGCR